MSNYLNSCTDIEITDRSGVTAGRRVIQTLTSDGSLRGVVKTWIARSRQRRQLARLPSRLLADIGVSASDAAEEAAKPFWME